MSAIRVSAWPLRSGTNSAGTASTWPSRSTQASSTLSGRQLVDAGELQRAAVAFAGPSSPSGRRPGVRPCWRRRLRPSRRCRPRSRRRRRPGRATTGEAHRRLQQPAAGDRAGRRRGACGLAGVGPHLGHQRARAAARGGSMALDRLRQRLHRRLQPAHLLPAALAAFEVALELGRLARAPARPACRRRGPRSSGCVRQRSCQSLRQLAPDLLQTQVASFPSRCPSAGRGCAAISEWLKPPK